MADGLTVMVLHWGRLGAGPHIAARFADALARRPGVRVLACMEGGADARPAVRSVDLRLVHTYRGRTQLLLRLPHLLRLALGVRRWMQREGVDVYFSPMLSVWQSLVLRVMVPKNVLSVHVIHDAAQHPGDAHPVLDLCRSLEVSHADVVVAFSEHSAALLRDQVPPGTPVIAVPHGADRGEGIAPRRMPAAPVVGFFGRITEYKGIAEYAAAVREIAVRVPGARGVVIGDGEVDPALVAATGDVIDWRVGWVDASAVDAAIDGFDLVLLPYQEASQSGVMALAASRGVPVVATPVGGLPEQAALFANTVLSSDATAAAVADAAIALLTDRDRYETLSAAGLTAVDARTGWSAVAEQLLDGLAGPLSLRR